MHERAFPKGLVTCTSTTCKASLLVGSKRDEQFRTLEVNGWAMIYDPEFDRLMPFCSRCC